MSAAPNPIPPGNKSTWEHNLLSLTVNTADPATEVFVIDNDLNLAVPKGVGGLVAQLPPGIYKVRARTAYVTTDKLVVLKDGPVTISFEAQEFASPLPLPNTAKSDEEHQKAAYEQSREVHVSAGHGSSIFVFTREWTKLRRDVAAAPSDNPAGGLKLKTLDGSLIADLDKDSSKSDAGSKGDPWAACTISLDPGAYRLSLQVGKDELEQMVFAPADWHVHVFLALRNYSEAGHVDRMADLASAGITLSRNQQFVDDAEDARLVELTRLGLAQGKKVISPQQRHDILHGKFNDPMLGVFGAHLLLMEDQLDLQLLTNVVENLRGMLGTDHPDVEALASKLRSPGSGYPVRVPPMLQRSWQLFLEGTVDQRCTFARDSLAGQIFSRTVSGRPWLLWMSPAATDPITAEECEETLKQYIFGRKTGEAGEALSAQSYMASREPHSGLQSMSVTSPSDENAAATLQDSQPTQAPKATISSDRIGELIRNMNVPKFYLDDLLKKLNITVPEK
jgi:hypothetical protein